MSASASHTPSSCPGKSAKHVFAQMTRASTTFAASEKEDVDDRVKPGHGAVGSASLLPYLLHFAEPRRIHRQMHLVLEAGVIAFRDKARIAGHDIA